MKCNYIFKWYWQHFCCLINIYIHMCVYIYTHIYWSNLETYLTPISTKTSSVLNLGDCWLSTDMRHAFYGVFHLSQWFITADRHTWTPHSLATEPTGCVDPCGCSSKKSSSFARDLKHFACRKTHMQVRLRCHLHSPVEIMVESSSVSYPAGAHDSFSVGSWPLVHMPMQ